MPTDELIPLTKQRIPTIVGFNVGSKAYTIGDEARRTGLYGKGQTAVFNFKPAFGAGDKEFSKDKDYWFHYPLEGSTNPTRDAYVETFSAKEAALIFLRGLFAKIRMPETVIVGEPGVREQVWRENFRRHVREVFSELGLGQPEFFPEPFAVFQYYRHVAKVLPVAEQSETVLIIDIGGGTFNSCIIRTTEKGLLARGGAMSIPLGLQAGTCGGAQIDKELLKILIHRAQKRGLLWKDDPIARIEKRKSPVLLRIEDAKIRLSNAMSRDAPLRLANNFFHINTSVLLPKGEFHPDSEIQEVLTGEDLKNVIREMWRRYYGSLIIDTVNEARDRLSSALKVSLDRIDKVLVAGGSSRLPFMEEEIQTVLPTLVDRKDIIVGSDIGEAVAYGIAWECREQVRRDPRLSVGKIAPCVLNDLYLGFKETRRNPVQIPRVKYDGSLLANGQLLSAPFETEETIFKYELELPFDPSDRLLYVFSDKPILNSGEDIEQLNLSHDIFSVPKLGKPSRKCELHLEIKPTGLIKPVFWFRGKGNSARKIGEKVICPEFYFPGFQVKEGNAYIGLDFGNSNSYLVRFASIGQEVTAAQYPQFTISPKIKDRLRRLEIRLQELRGKGLLRPERLIQHARNEALDIIFHSNKIEGNPLTKGETEAILSQADSKGLSEKELEAKNLETAYNWMLENFESCFDQPEAFIREINRLITKGVIPNGGQYRTDQVSLSGMDFIPPQGSSVPAFMQQLGEEIKTRGPDRSPLEFAASLHTKLVWIHPFTDGNGRTARLLVNASLLAQGLPVLVVNYADRERYLYCLAESNKGDLSSMVEFFHECLKQQLENLNASNVLTSDTSRYAGTTSAETIILPKPKADAIDQAIQEVSTAEAVTLSLPKSETDDEVDQVFQKSGTADDPLTAVMREKVFELEKIRRAEYDAWKQSFLTVSAELKAIVEGFNHQYKQAGFWMRLQEYDLLTFEKYEDICLGKGATRTWFVGLEISGPHSREKVLFFFNRASWAIRENPNASKVSLAISRFDGSRYNRLYTEPISLREICYRNGELLFLSRDGEVMPLAGLRQTMEQFLSEIIKSYL